MRDRFSSLLHAYFFSTRPLTHRHTLLLSSSSRTHCRSIAGATFQVSAPLFQSHNTYPRTHTRPAIRSYPRQMVCRCVCVCACDSFLPVVAASFLPLLYLVFLSDYSFSNKRWRLPRIPWKAACYDRFNFLAFCFADTNLWPSLALSLFTMGTYEIV